MAESLRGKLEALACVYGPGALDGDPLRFPRRYREGGDREVVALVCALFAYGNATAMGRFLEGLLEHLGPSPATALTLGPLPAKLPGYRFQTGSDTHFFLDAVGVLLRRFGSVEQAFVSAPGDPEDRLEALARLLRGECGPLTPGLAHLLPLPSSGSACKRWWLFLRWVVRPDDGVDLGLWRYPAPAELRVPVDTHVARMARALGLTRRRTPDRSFALEVTRSLLRIAPEDPARFDFALAQMGIRGDCTGRRSEDHCPSCSLRGSCADEKRERGR